ncbi:MAG TPA: GNAT family N-acetyltransferase [Nocardioidaceae bacterium]|nr:GNAT family N-acetyltransferase [Nocardioidaceae bacterium]
MSRSPVQVRDATPDDAEALLEIWADFSRRTYSERFPAERPEVEVAAAVARIVADPDQRLLVGALDGKVIAAVHLMRAPMAPIYIEQAIHITHLHVLDEHRRHGIGHALIEATVSWAEEKDTGYVLAAASVNSRDANRFMARLGLAQVATVRGATVGTLRAKLPVEPAAAARMGSRSHRSVGQVLAHRRSLRRSQSKSPD